MTSHRASWAGVARPECVDSQPTRARIVGIAMVHKSSGRRWICRHPNSPQVSRKRFTMNPDRSELEKKTPLDRSSTGAPRPEPAH